MWEDGRFVEVKGDAKTLKGSGGKRGGKRD